MTEAELIRLTNQRNLYKAALELIHQNALPSNVWVIADRALYGEFNLDCKETYDMSEKIKVNIIDRLEAALQQRTCIWHTDIQLAIDEINDLRKEVQELKDKDHLKKLNKVKGAE
jgi:FtsZ-binding cell division protein ZapB